MSIKAVFFDLDGTLLPMDLDEFIKAYFGGLAAKLAPYGYEPKKLVDTILKGTYKMVKNDGSKTNEQVFWDHFSSVYGEKVYADSIYFDDFYVQKFDDLKSICGYDPEAEQCVK